jgi:hypothetical protein
MAKPVKRKPATDSLFGWLGRQVGHVKKAVKADVTKKKESVAAPKPKPKVVYRDDKVEEADHPTQPGVKLRRTVIDEVIVDPNKRME